MPKKIVLYIRLLKRLAAASVKFSDTSEMVYVNEAGTIVHAIVITHEPKWMHLCSLMGILTVEPHDNHDDL